MGISLHRLLSRFIAILTVLSVFFLLAFPMAASGRRSAAAGWPQTWDVNVGVQLRDSSIEGKTYAPREIWINVGDVVKWHAASDIEHTVTFLRPGQKEPAFDRHDPLQIHEQGGRYYDGKGYFNSGMMSNFPPGHEHAVAVYSLTFNVPGNFVDYSLPDPAMTGIIHVRPTGTAYPYTNHDYYLQGLATAEQVRQVGQRLATAARKYATNHFVIVGVGNDIASDFTFTPPLITINAGDTVTFQYADNIEEHTVTFGNSQLNNEFPYGNPAAFDGTTPFNSGWLCTAFYCSQASYQVTFMQPGTFVLRDDLNKYTTLVTVIVLK